MPPIVSEEYKRQKKKEILNSALACFAKKGFQAATIDDIVAHSSISKGAIYNYFKSKEEIYLELMNEQTNETNELLTEKINSFQTATERLLYLFDLYISIDPFDPDRKETIVVHYEFRLHSSRDENLRLLLQERGNRFFIDFVTKIVEQGVKTGEFKKDINPIMVANLFWTIIDGATVQAVLYKEYPYQNILECMKGMVMDTLLETKS
ncbi:TetR/AcrR family transcriptional regulator [Bacillus sp. 31A1R]|uniref:TetR/AcrR family transcriptional regulator n=1 Tax=Robertmurraya mangrovi TaxID=3098077 RepID=A0ABU5ITL6_9BACI|nr:TetR/AcrR family transcriptional regulator [Bacillus sp. 31A1R]MDZ5470497.1 TetR/AcrR family transcriptional regulator [Bacillus sp. 31A1R]